MWYQDKVFWLNVLAVVAAGVGYAIDNSLAPKWIPWMGLALVVIDAITISLKNQSIMRLTIQTKILQAQNNQPKPPTSH